MKNGEIPQRHETRYGAMLDEMLGIRSKKGNVTQEVEPQAQQVERSTARHSQYGEAIKAAATYDSFPSSLRTGFTNKGDIVVERWQREYEEKEGSDNEKDDMEEEEEVEESNSDSNDANGIENELREEIRKVEAVDNKCENDVVEIAQEITCSSATVEKTKTTEGPVSEGKLCDTFRMRSISTISKNKTDSELRKPVEKHSRITALNESPSSGKAAYEKWFREKLKQEREKRRKQKEKEEEERKAKEARRREAERNYEIWKRRSDEAIRERMRNEKEKAEALAKEKTEEMRRKKEEASKMFQAWKNDRLQRLSKERKQRMKNKESDELKKKREMEIRNTEAQKAFNAWYEDNKIRNAEVQRKLLESRKTEEMQSRNAKEYKEALAREAYDIWLQIKESERHFNESLQGRIMKIDEISRRSHLVPWIPPSNSIPRQFIPTRARRHQSVKQSIKYNQTCRKFPSANHRSKSALR